MINYNNNNNLGGIKGGEEDKKELYVDIPAPSHEYNHYVL